MVCQQNCIFENLCSHFNGRTRTRVGIEPILCKLVSLIYTDSVTVTERTFSLTKPTEILYMLISTASSIR